jgi:hypothetical protein
MKTTRINEESVKSLDGCTDVFEFLGKWLKTNIKGETTEILVSNQCDGITTAPSQKKNYYKTTNFIFSPDSFKNLSEMMESVQLCIVIKKKTEEKKDV